MKKPTPWAEDIQNAIAKAYKQGQDDAFAQFSKNQRECYEYASKIMQRTAAFRPPSTEPRDRLTGPPEAAAPKRKAVTATPQQVFHIHDALVQLHGAAVSIKNLRGATGVGPKIIGSALRALVKAGTVVESPRGKFKAVPAQTADGATSEAP